MSDVHPIPWYHHELARLHFSTTALATSGSSSSRASSLTSRASSTSTIYSLGNGRGDYRGIGLNVRHQSSPNYSTLAQRHRWRQARRQIEEKAIGNQSPRHLRTSPPRCLSTSAPCKPALLRLAGRLTFTSLPELEKSTRHRRRPIGNHYLAQYHLSSRLNCRA